MVGYRFHMKSPICMVIIALTALALSAAATPVNVHTPAFDIDALLRSADAPYEACAHDKSRSGISVSGVSSGACMANQFFVAYSSIVDSLGSIAGLPWFASGGNVGTAMAVMKDPSLVVPDVLRLTMIDTAAIASIDPVQCLSNTTAFIIAGQRDSVVHPLIAPKLKSILTSFGVGVESQLDLDAEHSFPTLSYGNACAYLGANYISACNYDTPGYLFLQIMQPSPLMLPRPVRPEGFVMLRQEDFALPVLPLTMYLAGLDSVAYAYIPEGCSDVLRFPAVARSIIRSGVPPLDPEPKPEIDPPTAERLVREAASSFKLPRFLHTDSLLDMRLAGPAKGSCKVHFALHGCQQTRDIIGDIFVEKTGYNRWAEANNIIVIYPFARANVLNPKGCWDWWGYSGLHFATKMAPQTVMMARMAAAFRYNIDF